MPLTAQERSAINRENGKKGGPKTPEGKAVSCRNALKHGLRAEVLVLENEDPDEIAARIDEWDDYYRPESPAERYNLKIAVRATVTLDRCARAQDATLDSQVRHAPDKWDRDRYDAVQDALLALNDPGRVIAAFLELHRTALGCRAMAQDVLALRDRLADVGHWTIDERKRAQEIGDVSTDTFELVGPPRPSSSSSATPAGAPDRDAIRAAALAQLDQRHADLTERAARLEAEHDLGDRASAADRALILADDKFAGKVLRYQNAAHSTYFRAVACLEKSRKERRARGDDPADEPPASPEATPPNGPNSGVKSEKECNSGEASPPDAGRASGPASASGVPVPGPSAVNGTIANETGRTLGVPGPGPIHDR